MINQSLIINLIFLIVYVVVVYAFKKTIEAKIDSVREESRIIADIDKRKTQELLNSRIRVYPKIVGDMRSILIDFKLKKETLDLLPKFLNFDSVSDKGWTIDRKRFNSLGVALELIDSAIIKDTMSAELYLYANLFYVDDDELHDMIKNFYETIESLGKTHTFIINWSHLDADDKKLPDQIAVGILKDTFVKDYEEKMVEYVRLYTRAMESFDEIKRHIDDSFRTKYNDRKKTELNSEKGLSRLTLVLSILVGIIAIPIFHFAFERTLVGFDIIDSFTNFDTLSVHTSLKLAEVSW